MGSIANVLKKSHEVMDAGNKFTASFPGNKAPSYSAARQARADAGHAPMPEKKAPSSTGEDNVIQSLEAKKKNIGDYVKATSDQ